ncbi:solute carrier family 25 member 44 [Contarinia nasturtii]|uniref:solute carrier family 25 member 44 n=1 Tax=Contarinia nasturtii TaxID=265458 RepID=UPI0012D3953C|nr:solute carrier family 25 member 44 [Contarinia nasturtii]
MENLTPSFVKIIEWKMLDKRKFFPLSMLSSFSVRCTLYPLTLIKTQLQVQIRNDVYTGLIDAACKIYQREGPRGLYKGFWISSMQIFSGVFYISTYEGVRHLLSKYDTGERAKSLVAGGCASLVGQTLIVPFDVISQHAMVLGMGKLNPLGIENKQNQNRMRISLDIAKAILQKDGFRGFYRGYVASLMAYVPSSAIWWTFYHLYQDNLINILPPNVSHLFIQCVAGTMGGFSSTLITNPLDIIRARIQVQRLDSIPLAFRLLWIEENSLKKRFKLLFKGLSARLLQSAAFSFSIILGYESIKRLSIQEEYKHLVRW